MGDKIQWVNVDDENHTATGMSYTGQTVPSNYTFQSDFTKQHGNVIDASEWSTGTMRAHGGKSQVFVAKRVGHYFYGCGYHLGQGQIGVIVVGP
jgi:plastocyanin